MINMSWGEPTREMHGKKPSCGQAVHFYLQGPEPQLTAWRDFIEVSDSRQLHPLSRYHGETLNIWLLPFYTATSSRKTQEIF